MTEEKKNHDIPHGDPEKPVSESHKEGPVSQKIPRMLELYILKAAVEGPFLEDLVKYRSKIPFAVKFKLSAEEKALLDAMPENQLRSIVKRLHVNDHQKSLLERLFTGSESGPGIIEYALIAGLLGSVFIAATTASGGHIEGIFSTVSGQLRPQEIQEVYNLAVKTEQKDIPFSLARLNLERELNIEIQVGAHGSFDLETPFPESTKNLPFGEVMRGFGQASVKAGYRLEFDVISRTRVRLKFVQISKNR